MHVSAACRNRFLLLAILLLATALRLYHLNTKSFWFDEFASGYLAVGRGYVHYFLPENQIIEHPPAMYDLKSAAPIKDLEERIIGVETGACPHTAVREDPSMNLAAVEDMEARFPDSDLVLIESGGDNLTLTFSPALVDFFIYVIDVAAGDKIPRKNGPGISQSDILVINKTDLAPYVGASLDVMDRDSRIMRGDKPFLFTNCRTGEGIPALVELIRHDLLFDLSVATASA